MRKVASGYPPVSQAWNPLIAVWQWLYDENAQQSEECETQLPVAEKNEANWCVPKHRHADVAATMHTLWLSDQIPSPNDLPLNPSFRT